MTDSDEPLCQLVTGVKFKANRRITQRRHRLLYIARRSTAAALMLVSARDASRRSSPAPL